MPEPEPERVLLIEDEPTDAELALTELRRAGMAIESLRVETREELEAALDRFRPTVILSDYSLPSLTGTEALEVTLGRAPDTPFILVTGSNNEEVAVACMKAGAWDYILKDRLSRLPLAVRGALDLARARANERGAQQALQRSADLLRTFIEASADGIIIKDGALKAVMANPAYAAMLGRDREGIVGRDDFELMPEQMARSCRESDLRALRGDAPSITEEEDSSGRTFETRKFPVPLADGSTGVGGFVRDITERKLAEQRLRESGELLSAFLEHSPIYAFIKEVTPGASRVLVASENYLDMVGVPGSQMAGKTMQELFPPEFAAKITADDWAVVSEGTVLRLSEELAGRSYSTIKFPIALGERTLLAGYTIDMTERERAEDALRASEARFQMLADVSPVGIFQTDKNGSTIYVNRRWTEISGLEADQAMGDGWLRAVHPDDVASVMTGWSDTVAGGRSNQALYRFLRANGTVAWVAGHAVEVRDASGHVTGYVGTITDITEQKEAEQLLRESEERYRGLFESSPIGFYRSTPDGAIVLANPALVEMLGYDSLDELRAHSFGDASFQPSYPRARFMSLVQAEGSVRGFEATWRRKDGSELIVRESARVARDEDGSVRCFEGALEDVTERARAEEARRRLAAAVEQSTEIVVVTDTNGTIEWVNPAFERVTGYSSAEVLGQNPRVLKSGRQDDAFYQDLWSTIMAGRPWSGHMVNRRKDGTLYEEEATISPVRDEQGAIRNFVAVKRDVTAEVALQQQLNHAQKMEAIGRLAGGIAHDFNNLLQAILSQLAVLELRLRGIPGSEKPIAEVGHLVRRGSSLTRQLLLFSKRGAAAREVVDLNKVVEGAADLLRRVVRENVAIVTEPTGEPLEVLADPGQLDQVLMNLAVNASDAMPEGGTLTLRTGGDASQVVLSVTDTGEGMSPDILSHMFEPFFTTKGSGKGTGLGLSVVHGIVTSHGGTVKVASEPSRGSTFTMSLPRHGGGAGPPVSPTGDFTDLPLGRGERVLVVEDEEGARQGLLEILGALGYAVTAAASGEEAGAFPESPAFDLLLTDFLLSGITGADLARRLRERWPQMKVIVMSGYAEDETLRHAGTELAAAFLQKPFDMQALARTVRHMLDGGPVPHMP